ncbi:membrane protein [Nemania abortiva]|nr:membrane protein [Nemania abortiva]
MMDVREVHTGLGHPTARPAKAGIWGSKGLHYAFACCGLATAVFFLIGLIAADFLPPLPPHYTAERIAEHYEHHQTGIHVCSAFMMFAGTLWLPYTVVISDQLRRIPKIPWLLPTIQLASGIAGIIGFLLPGMVLGVAGLRIERDPEVFQLLNDMFWLFFVMPFQPFVFMTLAWAYAILIDDREIPLYPKFMAVVNFVVAAMLFWSTAVHVATRGPFSWNGALGFWVPLAVFGLQLSGDTYFLLRAIHRDYLGEAEGVGSEGLSLKI